MKVKLIKIDAYLKNVKNFKFKDFYQKFIRRSFKINLIDHTTYKHTKYKTLAVIPEKCRKSQVSPSRFVSKNKQKNPSKNYSTICSILNLCTCQKIKFQM